MHRQSVRFLLSAIAFFIFTSPTWGGVRSVDPKRARTRLESITPAPDFPGVELQESKSPSPECRRLLARAKTKFDNQLWADAIALLKQCIQTDAACVDARILLARAASRQGDSTLALEQLRQAAKYRPRDATIHQLMGEIAWQNGNTSQAIPELRLALLSTAEDSKSPVRALAHLTLALALEKNGYLTAAADQMEAYLAAVYSADDQEKSYPELAEVLPIFKDKAPLALGDIYIALEDYEKAAAAYAVALKEKPDDFPLVDRHARALARAGQAEQAFKSVRDAFAKFQGDPRVYELLRQVCDTSKQPERYQTELKKLAEKSSDSSARLQLVQDLLKNNDDAAAIDALEGQLKAHPDDTKSREDIIRLSQKNKQYDKMLEHLVQLLDGSKSSYRSIDALLERSESAEEAGALADAATRYAAEHPKSIPARFLQARFSADPAKAQDLFVALAKDNPTFAPAVIQLARLHAANAQWEDALSVVKSAIKDGMKDPELYVVQGRAYEALDDMNAAEQSLMEAFKLDNKSPQPFFVLAEAADHRRDFAKAERLHQRILEDIDPKFIPSISRLCRFYLNNDRIQEARQLLEDAKTLKLDSPAIRRCKAHLELKTDSPIQPADRIKKYRQALEQVLKESPKDVDTLLDLAQAEAESGDLQTALVHVDQALAIEPSNYLAAERKAQIHYKRSDLTAATEALQSILKKRPHDLMYEQMLIELYVDQDDYGDAAKLIRQMIARELPDQARTALRIRLFEVLELDEKYDELVDLSQAWLKDSPGDMARRQVYLAALSKAGQKDKAVKVAADWLDAAPADDSFRTLYIEQLRQAGRLEEAKGRVLRWLADDPDDLQLNGLLIQLFWLSKEWRSAVETALTGMELTDQRSPYEPLLGQSYLGAREYDKAIDFYRERAAKNPSEMAQRDLINALVTAERYEEAEKTALKNLQALLETRDTHTAGAIVRMRSLLAQIYLRSDHPRKAISQLEEVYKIIPTDPSVNNDLGYTYADLGINVDKAESMIRLAIAERPRESAYLDSLGWVKYKQDKASEAVPLIRRAVRLQRDDPDPILLDHLADALYKSGNKDEARKIWDKASKLREGKDELPSNAEERAALKRIARKIEQFDKGDGVDVAPIAGNSASQPSDDK